VSRLDSGIPRRRQDRGGRHIRGRRTTGRHRPSAGGSRRSRRTACRCDDHCLRLGLQSSRPRSRNRASEEARQSARPLQRLDHGRADVRHLRAARRAAGVAARQSDPGLDRGNAAHDRGGESPLLDSGEAGLQRPEGDAGRDAGVRRGADQDSGWRFNWSESDWRVRPT
jgi:hypothetical protein